MTVYRHTDTLPSHSRRVKLLSRLSRLPAAIRHELTALLSTVARTSRSLRRAPGFVAIATLSLGVAPWARTSVFALIDAMRHPESPFRAADQLFDVAFYRMGAISGPTRHDVDEALANLNGVSERSSYRYDYLPVETNTGGERRGVMYTRPGFFKVLGLQPRVGHLPSPADEARGDVAMVSDALWRSRYDNRSRVDGAMLTIGDNQSHDRRQAPPRAEIETNFGTAVWVPDTRSDSAGAGDVVLRIPRAGRDTVLVERQLTEIARRWSRQFLSTREQPYSFRLSSMKPNPLKLGDYHRAIIGAAICILIIACANVAALMLARGMVRRRYARCDCAWRESRRDLAGGRDGSRPPGADRLRLRRAHRDMGRRTDHSRDASRVSWAGASRNRSGAYAYSARARWQFSSRSLSRVDSRRGRRAGPIPWDR